MSRIILVHGSWHGAWCWHKVATRLRVAGHTVVAPDLPGHGRDWTAARDVTLQNYTDRVLKILDNTDEPSVVVAHSRGGIVLSTVAEQRPEKIQCGIYLAAVLALTGETVFDLLQHAGDSRLLPYFYQAEDGSWDMLREEGYRDALYHDCSEDDIELCHQLLTPEPLAPSLTAMALTPERYGRVRKAYIELTADRAVPLAWQRYMHGRESLCAVRSIDASHSAYFSQPEELARVIDELAGQ